MRALIVFLLIAYGWSWGVGGIMYANGVTAGHDAFAPSMFAYMLGPLVGALVAPKLVPTPGAPGVGWKPAFEPRIWLLCWLVPILMVGAGFLLTVLLGPSEPHPDLQAALQGEPQQPGLVGGLAIMLLVVIPLSNILATIGEEAGWRGYMWAQLRKRGMAVTVFTTGLFWGLWHLPAVYLGLSFPDTPLTGIFMMTCATIAISYPMTVLRDRARSVWGSALFHSTFNGVSAATTAGLAVATIPWTNMFGIGGIAAAVATGWVLERTLAVRDREGPEGALQVA